MYSHINWTDIKTIFHYLKCTIDIDLFYPYKKSRKDGKKGEEPVYVADHFATHTKRLDQNPSSGLSATNIPYSRNSCDALVGFLVLGISLIQIKVIPKRVIYIFTIGNIVLSWRFTKQIFVSTSSNHAEIIVFHEVVHECI